jgi:NAD(P)H dehydrogenase (quinone)
MKILIILGHPAKKRQSLSEALANAYKEGAIESGHEVCLYKVADKQFDPILHEGYVEEQAAEPDIIEAQERIRWADHLVFVYPLWDYMIPALLKGFLERTFTRGFAYLERDSQKKGKLLAGKSARLIQTSGMPAFIYAVLVQSTRSEGLTRRARFLWHQARACHLFRHDRSRR